jgi:hypothetical protein
VLAWGFDPLINVLARRASPTRFGFNYPLIVAQGTDLCERWRWEFMEGMNAAPPVHIAIADKDENNLMKGTSLEHYEAFAPLRQFVSMRYALDRHIDNYVLWRLRD